jgi:mannose-6-phosphate isomerase-like protein (cupin superfamily)
MPKAEQKHFNRPDETRTFEKGKIEEVRIGGGTVGRFVLQPGWKWSLHVKPIAKTAACQNAHFGYHVSGRLHVAMTDGTSLEVGPGEVSAVPAGHDAWVVGNEPVVLIDWTGAGNYAKQ